MISQKASRLSMPIVVAAVSEDVVTNQPSLNSLHNQLSPCNHEEADTRLILHVLNGSFCGFKKISIVTVDTDLDELWIEFGVGKNKRYLPNNNYAKALSEEICRALPFWFAMAGCGTVSMFAGRGKKSAWNAWDSFKKVTPTYENIHNHSLRQNKPVYRCEPMQKNAVYQKTTTSKIDTSDSKLS